MKMILRISGWRLVVRGWRPAGRLDLLFIHFFIILTLKLFHPDIYQMLNKFRELSIEYYLRHFAHKPQANPSWKLDPAQLKEILIRWPAKYEWDNAKDWVEILLYGFRTQVKVEKVEDIPQPYKGTVVFQIVINGKTRTIAIGYSDYMPVDEESIKDCDLYFKMQYQKQGYGTSKVVPGGYIAEGSKLYLHLPKLRKLRDKKHYIFDVYGRFGLNAAKEIREKAINILNNQKSFHFEGGMKSVSYVEFLKEVAQSKICIDLPGQGDFCFRLINYMAVGSCVIASPHRTALHVPLVDRKHIVFVKEDYSDWVELCEYYLKNDEEREQIAMNSREFFDLYLHKDNLVKYYLKTCVEKLG
jgi:hypothetical protein